MKTILTILLAMGLFTGFSQEGDDEHGCECCMSYLKLLVEGKTVDKVYTDCGLSGMASSFLMQSGTPPKIVETPGDIPDYGPLVVWTCKYAPGNVIDGDVKTAWVEGSKDYGVGEIIIVACLDLKKPIQIWSGYGKSPTIFTQNSRPKKIKTMIIRADNPGFTENGTWYEHLQVIKQMEVELKDLNGFQTLAIPSYTVAKYVSKSVDREGQELEYNYFLGIVILDVYKGTKYADTCISEIKN